MSQDKKSKVQFGSASIANVNIKTSAVEVAGNKVIGTRGLAVANVAAPTGDIVDAPAKAAILELQTQVNALLARLRAHGLIAT